MMNKSNVSFSLVAMIGVCMLAGCTHQYQWSKYDVTDRLPAATLLNTQSSVAVVNGQPDDKIRTIGNIGVHTYEGSLNQLTDAVVTQLKDALQSSNINVASNGQKKLTIKVHHPHTVQGAWRLRAAMDIDVQTGDGVLHEYEISNSTPGSVPRALNGAVALAVLEILNDEKIQNYLKD